MGEERDKEREKETEKQSKRQRNKQTDRQTDRQRYHFREKILVSGEYPTMSATLGIDLRTDPKKGRKGGRRKVGTKGQRDVT